MAKITMIETHQSATPYWVNSELGSMNIYLKYLRIVME